MHELLYLSESPAIWASDIRESICDPFARWVIERTVQNLFGQIIRFHMISSIALCAQIANNSNKYVRRFLAMAWVVH
jgi:uncharacterized protein (DUF1810 family)